MMAPRITLDIAVSPGTSLRISFRIPRFGTARLLRTTKTPTRFVSALCIISGSIPARHRSRALQTSGSLKLALQFRLRSKLLLNRTPRRQSRPQRRQLQLLRLQQRRRSHLLRVQHRLRLQQLHLHLRRLQLCGLLPRRGLSRPAGNAQRRILVREVAGYVCNKFRTKCFRSAIRPRIAFGEFLSRSCVGCVRNLESAGARLPLPSRSIDHDDFSLVWPVVRGFHKAGSNRIIVNVVPFLCVAFVAPQNVIKESRLPKSWQL
jgi:hypothetical protein